MNLYKWKVLCYELFFNQQRAKISSNSVNSKKFIQFVIVSIIAPVKVSMMPSAPTTAVLPPPPPTTTATHRPKIGFSIDSIVGGEGGGDSKKHQHINKIYHHHHNDHEEDISKLKSLQRSQKLSAVENEKNGNTSSAPSSPDPCCKDQEENFSRGRDVKPSLANLPYPFPLHHLNNNNSIGNGPIRPIPFPIHAQRQLPHLLHPAYVNVNNSISSGGGGGTNNASSNHREKIGDSSAVNNRASSSRSPSPSSDSRKSALPDSPPLSRPGSSASATETTTVPGNSSPHTNNPQSSAHPHNPMHPGFPSAPGQRPPHISPTGHAMVGPPGLPPGFGGYPPGVLNFAAAVAHHHSGLPPPWAQPQHQPHPAATHPLYPWLLARQSRLFPHRFGPGPELSGFLFQPFRKPKRIRTAFTPNQLLRLEHAFEKNHYVVGTERKQLAKTLSLSETQVKVWFQNRRTKHKRTEQEEQSEKKYGNGSRSDLPTSGSNLSSSATSADSTRNYSEGMSDDEEEIVMDEEYSDEEEMAAAMHHNFHRT